MSGLTSNPTMNTEDAAVTLALISREAGPLGEPGGHLYARVMKYMTLQAFEAMMARIVRMGDILEKRGQCYHYIGPVVTKTVQATQVPSG